MWLSLLALGALADDVPDSADAHIAAIAALHAEVSVLYADAQSVGADQRILWCIEDRLTVIELQQDLVAAARSSQLVSPADVQQARLQAERSRDEALECGTADLLNRRGEFADEDEPLLMWADGPGDFVPDNERTPMAVQAFRVGGSFGIDRQPRGTVGTRLQLGDLGFTELHFHVQPDRSFVSGRIFYGRSLYAGPMDLWFGANLEGAGDGLATEAAIRATMWLFWADVTGGVQIPWVDKPTPLPTVSSHLEYELIWLPPDMTLDLTADARWTQGEPMDLRAGVMLDVWWRGNARPW